VTTPEKSPGKSKNNTRPGTVEVKFTTPPQEILHFNRYSIERSGDFLQISLWFSDNISVPTPVFRGLILASDLSHSKETLKRYIEKIGPGVPEEQQGSRPPVWESPPVAFNLVDCVDRVKCSEVIIRKFSHKYVTDAAQSKSVVEGSTHGVYVSTGSLHRQFVVELISKASEKP
jgi:hypothetical protein